ELAVLELGQDGGKGIAQLVLAARPALHVLVQPHGPIAAGAELPALEVEEFIRRHVLRQDEATVLLQEDREDDAMENDVVLADEMEQARIGGLPPLLPSRA